jgi:pyruvate kinase
MTHSAGQLLDQVDRLIAAVTAEGEARVTAWSPIIDRPAFGPGALNLACYLALRQRDLRPLQRPLMALGLSSLGRLEGRVLPTLKAVRVALSALAGHPPARHPSTAAFFAGEVRLRMHAQEILGAGSGATTLLVTCPTAAAQNGDFMLAMAQKGVEAIRINCAHDCQDDWRAMISHLRQAEAATGRTLKLFMDLAGPKIRTGRVRRPAHGSHRAHAGDMIALTAIGDLGKVDLAKTDRQHRLFAVECTLTEALTASREGDRVFIDDGRLGATIEQVTGWGLVARVTTVTSKGRAIKSEKGLNFPDRHLNIDALTEKDRTDLAFVSAHADGIGFSFVQSAADVVMLQEALARHRPADWQSLALILKIETARAVSNLPEIIVQAAGRQPAAIMIARGDLAVEIGFARTAEMQEEILWLGEAADLPVIWATQVLEGLISRGMPSRGEMTDAAMAARAECVMLNKGPFLNQTIDQLRALLARMGDHQHKKTPQLRALKSWETQTAAAP